MSTVHSLEQRIKRLESLYGRNYDTTVTVNVGSTTTGAAGTNANVTNSGDEVNAIFDFVIPRGNKGDKGDTGDKGDKGDKGDSGIETGVDGIWNYRKYSDGTYEAWFDANINLLAGTLWSGGFYYHVTSSEYPAPSFSKSVKSRNAHANSAVLLLYAGHNGNQYIFANASSAAFNAAIHAEVRGTW